MGLSPWGKGQQHVASITDAQHSLPALSKHSQAGHTLLIEGQGMTGAAVPMTAKICWQSASIPNPQNSDSVWVLCALAPHHAGPSAAEQAQPSTTGQPEAILVAHTRPESLNPQQSRSSRARTSLHLAPQEPVLGAHILGLQGCHSGSSTLQLLLVPAQLRRRAFWPSFLCCQGGAQPPRSHHQAPFIYTAKLSVTKFGMLMHGLVDAGVQSKRRETGWCTNPD